MLTEIPIKEVKPPQVASGSACAHPSVLQIGNEWLTVRAGGLNRYAWGLANSLEELGVSQRWIVMSPNKIDSPKGIRIDAAASPADSLLARSSAIRECFKKSPFDLCASHFALYAYAVRRELRKMPHVVHFHGPWAEESGVEGARRITIWAKRYVENAVYATGDRFITLSRAFSRILTTTYKVSEERIRIIPGGIDAHRYDIVQSKQEARQIFGWPTDRPIVFCLRRLAKRMGLEELVLAIAELKRRDNNFLLLIGGRGQLDSVLKSQIEQLGLQENVRILGPIAESDLALAYRAADFSIVPSQSLEGFGLITLESLAAGTPVLVSPIGGLPEIVSPLDPQLIMPSPAAADIADSMHAVLSQATPLPTADECQRYVRTHFDWSVIAPQVLEVYQEAMTTK